MIVLFIILFIMSAVTDVFAEERIELEISTSFNQVKNWSYSTSNTCIDHILKLNIKDFNSDYIDFNLNGISRINENQSVVSVIINNIPLKYEDIKIDYDTLRIPVKEKTCVLEVTTRDFGSITALNYKNAYGNMNTEGNFKIKFPMPKLYVDSLKCNIYGSEDIYFKCDNIFTKYLKFDTAGIMSHNAIKNSIYGVSTVSFYQYYVFYAPILALISIMFFTIKTKGLYFFRILKQPVNIIRYHWGKLLFIVLVYFFSGSRVICALYRGRDYIKDCQYKQSAFSEDYIDAWLKKNKLDCKYDNIDFGKLASDLKKQKIFSQNQIQECGDFGLYFLNKKGLVTCNRHGNSSEIINPYMGQYQSRNSEKYENLPTELNILLPYQIKHKTLEYGCCYSGKLTSRQRLPQEMNISFMGRHQGNYIMIISLILFWIFVILPFKDGEKVDEKFRWRK